MKTIALIQYHSQIRRFIVLDAPDGDTACRLNPDVPDLKSSGPNGTTLTDLGFSPVDGVDGAYEVECLYRAFPGGPCPGEFKLIRSFSELETQAE